MIWWKRFRLWCHFWTCFKQGMEITYLDGTTVVVCECGREF